MAEICALYYSIFQEEKVCVSISKANQGVTKIRGMSDVQIDAATEMKHQILLNDHVWHIEEIHTAVL